MRVGINPIQWPREQPLDEVAEVVSELGYSGIEGAREYLGRGADLRLLLDDCGLELTGGYYAANWFDRDWRPRELKVLRELAEFYASLGARFMVVGNLGSPSRFRTAGHMPQGRNDGLTDYQWGFFTESISLAGEICLEEFDLRLVFHNHAGTFVETAEEIDRLLKMSNPATVFLCADTGHLFYGGVDPADFFERNIQRIKYVHLKDVDADVFEQAMAARASFREFVEMDGFPEVGAGLIDFEAIFEILQRSRYEGWVVVEQDYTSKDPAVAAGASIEYVNGKIGV